MHKRQVQVDSKCKRLDARGAVWSLFIGHSLVPEILCGIDDMVQRLPAISRFSTAVTVRAVAMTGRAIRFEGNGLGWGGPFLFFRLIVKASRQPVLHQHFSLHLLSFSPHALFWLHSWPSRSLPLLLSPQVILFLRRRLSCFVNVKDVSSTIAIR